MKAKLFILLFLLFLIESYRSVDLSIERRNRRLKKRSKLGYKRLSARGNRKLKRKKKRANNRRKQKRSRRHKLSKKLRKRQVQNTLNSGVQMQQNNVNNNIVNWSSYNSQFGYSQQTPNYNSQFGYSQQTPNQMNYYMSDQQLRQKRGGGGNNGNGIQTSKENSNEYVQLKKQISDQIQGAAQEIGKIINYEKFRGQQCRVYKENDGKLNFKLASQTTGEYEKYKPLKDILRDSKQPTTYFKYFLNDEKYRKSQKCQVMGLVELAINRQFEGEFMNNQKVCTYEPILGSDKLDAKQSVKSTAGFANFQWNRMNNQYVNNRPQNSMMGSLSPESQKLINKLYQMPINTPIFSKSTFDSKEEMGKVYKLSFMVLIKYQVNQCLVFQFAKSPKDINPTLKEDVGYRMQLILSVRVLPSLQKKIDNIKDQVERQQLGVDYCTRVFQSSVDQQKSLVSPIVGENAKEVKYPYQPFTLSGALLSQYFSPFVTVYNKLNGNKKTINKIISKDSQQMYKKIRNNNNQQFYGKPTMERYKFYREVGSLMKKFDELVRIKVIERIKKCLDSPSDSICGYPVFKEDDSIRQMLTRSQKKQLSTYDTQRQQFEKSLKSVNSQINNKNTNAQKKAQLIEQRKQLVNGRPQKYTKTIPLMTSGDLTTLEGYSNNAAAWQRKPFLDYSFLGYSYNTIKNDLLVRYSIREQTTDQKVRQRMLIEKLNELMDNSVIMHLKEVKYKNMNQVQQKDAVAYSRGHDFFDYTLCNQDADLSDKILKEVKEDIPEPNDPDDPDDDEPIVSDCADDDY